MLLIVCATFFEASTLIKLFSLKKDLNTSTKFQIFCNYNSNIYLIISGVGIGPSTIATTHLISLFDPKGSKNAFIINFGVCGARDTPIGSTFIVNKVTSNTTKRSFIPDILFQHPFLEGELTSYDKIKKGSLQGLVDMEGAGFYEAARSFFGPHQIFLLKTVSDNLQERQINSINGDVIKDIILKKEETISNFFDLLLNEKSKLSNRPDLRLIPLMDYFSTNLKLTVTNKNQLQNHLKYLLLKYPNLNKDEIIDKTFYSCTNVNNKKERRDAFEKLKKFIRKY